MGSQNRSNLSWNLINKCFVLDRKSSLVEASGGAFGFDFGLILGSILGSRAPYAIFAKSSTAPQREHDFRGSGGSKKRPKLFRKQLPATTWLQERLGSLWGSILDHFGAHFELPNRSKHDTDNKLIFKRFLGPLEISRSENWRVIWRRSGLGGAYLGG